MLWIDLQRGLGASGYVELIRRACEVGYQVIVATDQNMRRQQNYPLLVSRAENERDGPAAES